MSHKKVTNYLNKTSSKKIPNTRAIDEEGCFTYGDRAEVILDGRIFVDSEN